jgi:hypothetical protein
MTAVFCHSADDRSAATWAERLRPFGRLQFVASDAARGIAKAVDELAEARRREAPDAPPLEQGLDVFHTAMQARRILGRHWRAAEAAWRKAEAADGRVAGARRRGLPEARGLAARARAAWGRAAAAPDRVDRLEAAWGRARAALEAFRPDGRLNDRPTAEAQIAAATAELADPEWTPVRQALHDRRSLAFPDRMHRRLEQAEPDAERRAAAAWRWWLRHGRPRPAASPAIAPVRAVAARPAPEEPEDAPARRVAAVLATTVRASSAVECLNGVLRMQQARHKRMTQPMLDLKRLSWNCHRFGSGPRRGRCPYQALGLSLPTYDFRELLQADPAELTQELSTQRDGG